MFVVFIFTTCSFFNDEIKKEVSSPPEVPITALKIINLSDFEIPDPVWNDTSFLNSPGSFIKIGANVMNNVSAGSSYIFFKLKSSPIMVRTREIVTVETGETREFIFTNQTIIVDVNNSNSIGTLNSMKNKVVWFDGGEGEVLPYTERRSFVGNYSLNGAGLSNFSISNCRFFPPKNGSKAVAIGGTSSAMMCLNIILEKDAKLSFWYANKFSGTPGVLFSINGIEVRKWETDIEWSFIEFDLESGDNTLVWEKKDGFYRNIHYFFSLDDILIFYTE